MNVPISQVDSFTSEPFRGNPAGVCVLPGHRTPPDATWMQSVAREMNLAETAFLRKLAGGTGFELRWFTPTVEVDLCGHATLASAHILWQTNALSPSEPACFQTRSGLLTAVRGHDGWIELDFPATPDESTPLPNGLMEALGSAASPISPRYVGQSRFDYIIELENEDAVRALQPDFRRLAAIKTRGIIVTSRSGTPGVDFVSRFFAPAAGIDEDPVTGSSHCCLGPFWSHRLGKATLVAHQISPRGGVLRVTPNGDRVKLAGQAVTVLRGELTV
jgi:PhzF family phenazine biosynthesis protein